jgi:hypothetical protein
VGRPRPGARRSLALGLVPVGRLAGFQRHKLDGEALVPGPPERRYRTRRQLVVADGQRVLERMIRQFVDLAEIALGDEVEVRLALLVVGRPLVGDLPDARPRSS